MEKNNKEEEKFTFTTTDPASPQEEMEEEDATTIAAQQQPTAYNTGGSTTLSSSLARRQDQDRKNWERQHRLEKIQLKKQAKHKRDLIVRYDCEKCDRALNAYGAFYHWSGPGPLCMQCIEEDEELAGYKWECKANISR